MDSPREDLRDAKDHAKQAATATLKAMRSALDLAISKLEGDDAPADDATADGSSGTAPEPMRPGATQHDEAARVVE